MVQKVHFVENQPQIQTVCKINGKFKQRKRFWCLALAKIFPFKFAPKLCLCY